MVVRSTGETPVGEQTMMRKNALCYAAIYVIRSHVIKFATKAPVNSSPAPPFSFLIVIHSQCFNTPSRENGVASHSEAISVSIQKSCCSM